MLDNVYIWFIYHGILQEEEDKHDYRNGELQFT